MHKRLVVCCDGTWQGTGADYPGNVAKLAQAIPTRDGATTQLLHYDDGHIRDRTLGGFCAALDHSILQAYRYLVLNYETGDEIYLFGFSRGAYVVRSLAGLIACAGLLRGDQLHRAGEAYAYYRQHRRAPRHPAVQRYHALLADDAADRPAGARALAPVAVTLLACWDTAGNLGLPDAIDGIDPDGVLNRAYAFHDTTVSHWVRHALHVLAVDEQCFGITLMDTDRRRRRRDGEPDPATALRQAWFPGDHTAVGGGEFSKRALADGALAWVLEAMGDWRLGLRVDPERIRVDVSRWQRRATGPVWERGLAPDAGIHFIAGPGTRDLTALYRTRREQPEFAAGLRERLGSVAPDRYNPENVGKTHLRALRRQAVNRASARSARLRPGESTVVTVDAALPDNDTGIRVKKGERYCIEVLRGHVWQGADLPPCSADGWHDDDLAAAGRLALAARGRRRHDGANWLELVATVKLTATAGDEPRRLLRVGTGPLGFTVPAEGRIIAFANATADGYREHIGLIRVHIGREA